MPRVVELLRKALEWQALLASGEASNQRPLPARKASPAPGSPRSWACSALHPTSSSKF